MAAPSCCVTGTWKSPVNPEARGRRTHHCGDGVSLWGGHLFSWDFAAVWVDDVEYALNDGYPCLRVQVSPAKYSGGTGATTDPYRIGNASDWAGLCADTEGGTKHFLLIDDIDLADESNSALEPCGHQRHAVQRYV